MITIISGPSGSGKTRKAHELCKDGEAITLSLRHKLRTNYWPANFTKSVKNVIFEECALSDFQNSSGREFMKELLVGEFIFIDVKYLAGFVTRIEDIHFIFCISDAEISTLEALFSRRCKKINFIKL